MDSTPGINLCCFFCHKSFDADSTVNVFNLLQLFCYLKIKLKLDQNSVLLCSQCNTLGCQLYQQIVQLEVMKLKTIHSLELLVTKVTKNCGGDGDADVLQKLVKEKCISKLRNVNFPQVKLKRLAQVRIVFPEPEDPVMKPVSTLTSPALLSAEPEKSIVKTEVRDNPVNLSTTISSLKPKTFHKSRKPPVHPKACQFCAKVLRNSAECNYHQAECHPDKLLIEAKLSDITDSQFLQVCQDVLEKHNVIPSLLNSNSNNLGCLYCQNLYEKMKCLKHHTIKCHLSILTEKLNQLQKISAEFPATNQINNTDLQIDNTEENDVPQDQVISPISSPSSPLSPEPEQTIGKTDVYDNQSSKFLSSNPPSTRKGKRPPKNPKACKFCPKSFRFDRDIKYHEAQCHPDKLFLKGKLDSVSDSKFREICQDVLSRYAIAKNKFGCLYCQNSYNYRSCFKRHVVENHLSNLIDKVEKLQKIVSKNLTRITYLGCLYCNLICQDENDLKTHKNTLCETLDQKIDSKLIEIIESDSKNVSGPNYPKFKLHVETYPSQKVPCQFCPKTFTTVPKLQIHSHAEHYRHYLNGARIYKVNDEEFELHCQELFKHHSEISERDGSTWTCVYCSKKFPIYRNDYKSHLVDKHIDILFEKLNELQQKPVKSKLILNQSGRQVWKRACQYCGKWVIKKRLSDHVKYGCKSSTERKFVKWCKCYKKFYSLADFNKHKRQCNKKKKRSVKRVQCEKCGSQMNCNNLKVHQLKFCNVVNERRPREFVE